MAEVLGVVTGALQLIETALKAREYVKDFHNAPAEQQKLFSEMTTLKPLFEEFQKRVAASDATSTLKNMAEPLARFKTFSKRLTWTLWNKTEAKEYLVEFDSIESMLNAWLALGIWDAGQEHKKDHAAILFAVDNYAREQQDRNNVPGQILWCRGIPGAGKTILSSLVIHHLRDQFRDGNIGVASIYLNHKETETQTPANLLAGLWKQLVGTNLPLSQCKNSTDITRNGTQGPL
ncbi:hypothetical protein B0H14DRAFT_3467462 [Mycena olivaceomarginata]|nr:hypothetical protein B0H14DRAFT_3467462 [Mycena olivaceomarginata]